MAMVCTDAGASVAAVALWLFRKHMVARIWAYWHLSPQGVGFAEIYIDLCYSVSGASVGAGLGNLLDRTVVKQSALRLLVGSWLPTKLLLKQQEEEVQTAVYCP